MCLTLWLSGCSLPERPKGKIHGGWLAEYARKSITSEHGENALRRMWDMGVRWIAVGPEVWMEDIQKPDMTFGQHDEKLRKYIRLARKQGFWVMLLPRIESPSFFRPPFPFRADIKMRHLVDWLLFYDNYERMLLHYAKLCEEEDVQILAVGLEYRGSIQAHPKRWVEMIRSVRQVYGGKLTYSANWYKEFEEVTFWKELDYIGIGSYFEIAERASESVDSLLNRWIPIKNDLARISAKYNKPILFTEVGYPSFADAARYPWKWQGDRKRPLDLQHQADCYEAMFQTFMAQEWFAGVFLWRFYTSTEKLGLWEYSPEGKPAQEVIKRWFLQEE